jgi:hypothetical protein
MSTESATTNATAAAKVMQGMARESIVLVTVVIVLIGCGVAWTQVVNPFLKSQAEITAKTAETLLAIKDISQAVARTAEAQQQQAEAMAKMMERMEQRDRSGVR